MSTNRTEGAWMARILAQRVNHAYCLRSHSAAIFGSKRTHVPMRNEGMRPAFACLKIVIRETASTFASSSAVNAWPVRSIWSANVMGVETSEDGMVLPKQRDLCFLGGLSRMGERKPCL